MIDTIIANSDGSVTIVYTNRLPVTISGACTEQSLQLLEVVLDWTCHFKRIDDCNEITQVEWKAS